MKVIIKRTIGPRGRECPECGHVEGGQVTLWFEWSGGLYVDVGKWGSTEAKEVIAVAESLWQDPPTAAMLSLIVRRWLDEEGRAEIARHAREDW